MHSKRFMLLVVLMLNVLVWGLIAPQPVYAASVRYVVPGPDGKTSDSCDTWANACTLQYALSIASSGDQVWVKTGTYTPGPAGSSRTVTFTLKNGVAVYGGFAGGETSLSQRNWKANPTILSGDLNGNGLDDNDAYHVVTANGKDSSAVLDGFTVTGGNADKNVFPNFHGAGIFVYDGSPTLANLLVSGNSSGGLGGAIYLYQASLTLNNVTFSNNIAHMYGGAIYVFTGTLNLTNTTFNNNTAVDGGNGGAIDLEYGSNSTLSNVVFNGNTSVSACSGNSCAGGSGGAMYLSSSSSVLSNVIFYNNTAGGNGGAMDIENGGAVLTNATFSGNSSRFSGSAISMYKSPVKVRNSILWGNTSDYGTQIQDILGYNPPVYTRVLIQGGGSETMDADPLFVDAAAGDLHLRPASPAINYGDNTVTSPGLPATDLDGNPRIADSAYNLVDLGAYENQSPYNNAPVFSGSIDGLALLEDPASNPGSQIRDLLAGHVTDADGTAGSAGMAVYAADNTNGAWQFSNDSGATWTDLGTVSGASSTLLGPDAFLRFAPNANWNGTTSLSFRAWDIPPDMRSSGTAGANSNYTGGRTSFSTSTGTVSLIVTPVNDAPVFTRGADQVAMKDSAGQTVSNWVTAISAGPTDEAGQALNFIVNNDNNALFSVQPAISATGDLAYTPAANAVGSAVVGVSLHDDGGTADGGADTSAVQTFTIVVTPARVFVNASAAGANTGTSWADAYTDLQTALARTTAGCEIWVAAATYTPGVAGDNAATFTLRDGIAIYGGFAGTESRLTMRNWKKNITILSGDLNGSTSLDNGDAYHVVSAGDVSSTAVLDGFTISGGNAVSSSEATRSGGGMYLTNSSPTLNNLTFSGNFASGFGGGLYLTGSSPALSNLTFSGNTADIGGGVSLASSNSILNNVVFIGNNATTYGGGMLSMSGNPVFNNLTFSGNNAGTSGGGILLYNSNPQVRNSILWGNTAGSGAQVHDLNGTSAPVYTRVLIQGGGGTLDADPLFVDAAAGNLHLQFGSPAIDAGDSSVASPGLPAADLDGNPRISGDTVDLGAYEYLQVHVYMPMLINTR